MKGNSVIYFECKIRGVHEWGVFSKIDFEGRNKMFRSIQFDTQLC
jgi:hypothetical protein